MKQLSDRSAMESWFENSLWSSRWAVLVAVISSVIAALLMFYIAAVDTFYTIEHLVNYGLVTDHLDRTEIRAEAIAQVVEVIDTFLLAVVLLIFGLGLYELYISKIDHAYEDNDEAAEHLLSIDSLDDLKSRLGKVIMMILIVKFFEMAISMEVEDPISLLMFAGGVLMSGLALVFTEMANRRSGQKTRATDSAAKRGQNE
ncbi:MAG: YqhA family protein [Mariprofundus sp.]